MRLTYTTSVFDNDHTGSNGRGTGYQLSIVPDIRSKFPPIVVQYRLLDLLDGSFDQESHLRAYKDEQAGFDLLVSRPKEESVVVKPITDSGVIAVLTNIANSAPDVVADYKNGNQKALNVLMGLALKSHNLVSPKAVKNFFVELLEKS